MTISFGSGQTSGQPLVVTAIAQASAQTLHTAIAGLGTPQRIKIQANNLDPLHSHKITIGLYATGAALTVPTVSWTVALPIQEGALLVTDPNFAATIPELVLNGGSYLAVFADTASMVAISAIVDDQNGIPAVGFGSGQTSGLPLIPTTQIQAVNILPTSNNGLLLHTAPAGAATPNVIKIQALNVDPNGLTRHATLAIFAVGGTVPLVSWQVAVPAGDGLYNICDPTGLTSLVLNGAGFIQAWTTVASTLAFFVNAGTQAGGAGGAGGSSVLASGLIAAVQNASRFGMFENGGTGQATRTNGEVMMPRAGTLTNLVIKSDAAVGGGDTVTVAVFVNGVASGVLVGTLAVGDGTTPKVITGSISVAQGDLVTFSIATNNAGAPAANIQAAVLFS